MKSEARSSKIIFDVERSAKPFKNSFAFAGRYL